MPHDGVAREKEAKPSLKITCTCRVSTEHARVIATFDCLRCEGPGTLESPICLTKAVENLSREIAVDAIVLADNVHRYYDEEPTRLVLENARLLQQLSLAAERPPGGAATKRSPCGACAWRPQLLFGELAAAATEGFSMFHAKASERAGKASRSDVPTSIPACEGCVTQSLDDLRSAVERTRQLKSAATRRIVLSPGGSG